ncbi:hypothetical protein cgp_2775 [Corynebacterium glutamicum MB001]|uniref:Uncharacterized protein n=1 Tax=Corynebacterium glutamicum (strain ATCC 13032 / DSM 20300 / JCM 1318 / BCRC 11384 / CCUG 27702 / LMG 3730 / NBRC 12168 / NCIMB 10025 / NRRL B-2784 / 534) TaxID=196627 RepID=Q8NMP8_CORGL|nr:hypothetical protein cgp_2775 [Corynebacterium glutamicum MB001]ASW14837.1 hypothetical protein cgc1_2775 [Corynebacterium glutamicum]CAF21181.1 hypothetical protein cg2775 [Corynebacterium glutamicum ATCC 13032]CCH25652.1 hypothetical protein WA5_2432 [Corynebacterium glutamicum K051]QYO74483.1 hypothetical protein cgisf_2775 [Corynebacterium glutamicum]
MGLRINLFGRPPQKTQITWKLPAQNRPQAPLSKQSNQTVNRCFAWLSLSTPIWLDLAQCLRLNHPQIPPQIRSMLPRKSCLLLPLKRWAVPVVLDRKQWLRL